MNIGLSVSCDITMPQSTISPSPPHLIAPDDDSSSSNKVMDSSPPVALFASPSNRSSSNNWPEGSNNQLKLSVGCEESEEDDEMAEGTSVDELRENMRQWNSQCGPRTDFAEDLDIEMSADRIKAIIQGDNLMMFARPEEQHEHFVNEVFGDKPPKIHNGYLFGNVIGEGSYARVKEVVEEGSLVRRAIKIIKRSRIRKIPGGQENVEREIKILRKVQHQNVIRLIEVFRNEEKQKLYMVMEFCVASIAQIMNDNVSKRLPESEAHFYFCQLIAGLEYLHSLRIIHKDIKPGNLLLNAQFVLKISDFGVAEELSLFAKNDDCQLVQGTPQFQAPELVSGNSEVFSGFKVDVWSSGITLYNMISGEYPFQAEVIMKLFDNIAKQPLIMPTNVVVSNHLECLLRGMLEKESGKRWSLDEIKNCDWFRTAFDLTASEQSPRTITFDRPLTVTKALETMFGANNPHDRLVSKNDLDGTMHSLPGTSVPSATAPTTLTHTAPRRNRSFLSCILPNRSP